MADADLVPCLINRWILDYECFELWRKFSDNLRVHQTWQLMFIEYVNESSSANIFKIFNLKPQDDLELINILLIKLMNSISNASKLPPDNNTETLTPLEESLRFIDQLGESTLKEPAKALLMKLKRVIRQECVVICFRCYKLKLAKTVYERVWNGSNSKESASKASLLNLFKEDLNVSTALEPFSVSELTENCRKFFSKYFNILLVPFLIRCAERMFDVFGTTLSLTSKKKKITSENSKSKHFLIHCWFAEYFSYLAWKNIDHLDSKKFDWLLKFVSENNLETRSCLLIRFIFKFNERKSMEDSLNSYLSPLELCLELLNKAEKLNSDDCESSAVVLSALRWQLKRHAVLVWCGKNLYEKATIVFNRLFPDDDETDSKLKDSLENVLKGHDQLSLDEEKLESSVKDYFYKIFSDWGPYLLSAAEDVSTKMRQKAEKAAAERGNTESKKRNRTTKKLPDDFVSTDSIDEDAMGRRRKDLHRSSSGFDDEHMRRAHKEDESDFESKDMKDERWRKSEGRQKVWLEDEEEMLYRGVKRYGVGSWSLIARNMLPQRSEVEVKERWKVMIRQGKVDRLA